jgi:hypothetical protein
MWQYEPKLPATQRFPLFAPDKQHNIKEAVRISQLSISSTSSLYQHLLFWPVT